MFKNFIIINNPAHYVGYELVTLKVTLIFTTSFVNIIYTFSDNINYRR